VSREAAPPLWAQVKSAVTSMILDGGMQEGDKLPSEAELCERFGVSRIVVRQAMTRLVSERLIYRHQGRGAFVAKPREDTDFVGRIVGFSGDVGARNHNVSRRILSATVERPSPYLQNFLGIESNVDVYRINRVLSVDGVPRILVEIIMLCSIAPGLLDEPISDRSLYAILNERYGVVYEGAERWVEAASASAEQAQLLDVPEGSALLSIESRSYLNSGAFVEYFSAFYRTDQARLHFVIKPDATIQDGLVPGSES